MICHLTPTRTRLNLEIPVENLNDSKKLEDTGSNSNFLSVPGLAVRRQSCPTDDEDDDFVFLPSYFDAVRKASLANEDEEDDANDKKDGNCSFESDNDNDDDNDNDNIDESQRT